MPSFAKFTFCLGFVFTLLACSENYADAANGCQSLDQVSERAKLQQLLMSNGVPKDERTFLLAGTERRLKEVQSRALNARGMQCGIGSVRAHILGCMNSTLPSALRTTSVNGRSNKVIWGRTGLSSRGAVFIAMFHACHAGASETFLSN
jgi:hypothetical protein